MSAKFCPTPLIRTTEYETMFDAESTLKNVRNEKLHCLQVSTRFVRSRRRKFISAGEPGGHIGLIQRVQIKCQRFQS
jgi:hypothetical protein